MSSELVVVKERDTCIVDVAIPFENQYEETTVAWRLKINKYSPWLKTSIARYTPSHPGCTHRWCPQVLGHGERACDRDTRNIPPLPLHHEAAYGFRFEVVM